MKTKIAYFVALATLVLGLTACTTDSPEADSTPDAAPTPAESPSTEVEYDTCANTVVGYQIDYPEDWTISTGDDYACRWADPERFFVEPATEGPSTAIMVFDSPDPYDTVINGTFDELFYVTKMREDTTIDGRRAVRFEVAATGDGLNGPGTPSYGYVIDRDGKGFVVSTEGLPGDTGYEEDKKSVDTAIKTLKFVKPGA